MANKNDKLGRFKKADLFTKLAAMESIDYEALQKLAKATNLNDALGALKFTSDPNINKSIYRSWSRILHPDASFFNNEFISKELFQKLQGTYSYLQNGWQGRDAPPKFQDISQELKKAGFGVADDAAKAGASVADDAAKTGVGVADDAAKAGASVADDAAKTGVGVVDDAAKAGAGVVDDAAKAGAGVVDDAFRSGVKISTEKGLQKATQEAMSNPEVAGKVSKLIRVAPNLAKAAPYIGLAIATGSLAMTLKRIDEEGWTAGNIYDLVTDSIAVLGGILDFSGPLAPIGWLLNAIAFAMAAGGGFVQGKLQEQAQQNAAWKQQSQNWNLDFFINNIQPGYNNFNTWMISNPDANVPQKDQLLSKEFVADTTKYYNAGAYTPEALLKKIDYWVNNFLQNPTEKTKYLEILNNASLRQQFFDRLKNMIQKTKQENIARKQNLELSQVTAFNYSIYSRNGSKMP